MLISYGEAHPNNVNVVLDIIINNDTRETACFL